MLEPKEQLSVWRLMGKQWEYLLVTEMEIQLEPLKEQEWERSMERKMVARLD